MSETKLRSYDRSIDGDLPLICPIVATALFSSFEAIGFEASASVYNYSLLAFFSSIVLLMHLCDRQVARGMALYMILAPFVLAGFTGKILPVGGLFSFLISVALIGFSLDLSEKKGKYWSAKSFLWFLLVWYVIAGVSPIPSAAITFGLPGESIWWVVIAFYGLAGWFIGWLRYLDLIGGLVYGLALYLLAYMFPPPVAVWACSTNLVVIYLMLLIPSVRKILA